MFFVARIRPSHRFGLEKGGLMSRLQTSLVVGLCILALSGCGLRENVREMDGMQVDVVRTMEAPADPFLNGLFNGYIGLADAELAEVDLQDSDSFALRAEAAAQGRLFEPEHMFMRDIPEEHVAEMTDARARLMGFMHRGAREIAPDPAARAQVAFDCWMQEQEENNQPDDIAACRDAFYAALAELENLMPLPVAAPPPAPAVPPEFVVFFDFDRSNVDSIGMATIDEAVSAAEQIGAEGFSVTGHTDRAGSEPYNDALSLRRAEAIRAALVARGVADSAISIAGRGEAETAVPTADGVREAANRRVVIILQ